MVCTALHEFYLYFWGAKKNAQTDKIIQSNAFSNELTNDEKTIANLLANISSIQYICLYSKSKSTWNIWDKKKYICEAAEEKTHTQNNL